MTEASTIAEQKAIAMQASIVGMRNVDTHKSAVLTLHIPQELATKFVEQFGWPTKVDPIPVAIAKMNLKPVIEIGAQQIANPEDFDKPGAVIRMEEKPKREPTLANRIALICGTEGFHEFLAHGDMADHPAWGGIDPYDQSKEANAQFVRNYCGVESRSDIKYDTPEAKKWSDLYNQFLSSPFGKGFGA